MILEHPPRDRAALPLRRCAALTDKAVRRQSDHFFPRSTPPPYARNNRQAIIESGIKIVETAGNKPQEHVTKIQESTASWSCTNAPASSRPVAERMAYDCDLESTVLSARAIPAEDDTSGLILIPVAPIK